MSNVSDLLSPSRMQSLRDTACSHFARLLEQRPEMCLRGKATGQSCQQHRNDQLCIARMLSARSQFGMFLPHKECMYSAQKRPHTSQKGNLYNHLPLSCLESVMLCQLRMLCIHSWMMHQYQKGKFPLHTVCPHESRAVKCHLMANETTVHQGMCLRISSSRIVFAVPVLTGCQTCADVPPGVEQ